MHVPGAPGVSGEPESPDPVLPPPQADAIKTTATTLRIGGFSHDHEALRQGI
jgi:hypothetical protein